MTEESRPAEELRPAWAIKLQAQRDARQWSKWKMARQILDWEKGLHFPRDWATAYAKAFDMPEEELFATAHRSRPAEPQRSYQDQGDASTGTVTISIDPDLWDDDMDRRVLLQLVTLGLGAGTLGSTGHRSASCSP